MADVVTSGFSYVARKSCGCLIGAIPDVPERRREVQRHTSEWINAGYVVERVTDEVVRREYTSTCRHNPLPKTQVMFE